MNDESDMATPPNGTNGDSFLRTVREMAARVRSNIRDGAANGGQSAGREALLGMLNAALATEIVCVLRYRRHYYASTGLAATAIKQEFLQHSQEEQAHADQLAERIMQLGGTPDFNPHGLIERSFAEYSATRDLGQMILDDLVAERVAIESYRAMIRYVADKDSTTRRVLEGILATEEEHAEELLSMLEKSDRISDHVAPPAHRPDSAAPPRHS